MSQRSFWSSRADPGSLGLARDVEHSSSFGPTGIVIGRGCVTFIRAACRRSKHATARDAIFPEVLFDLRSRRRRPPPCRPRRHERRCRFPAACRLEFDVDYGADHLNDFADILLSRVS
jgi:hypothetical protein